MTAAKALLALAVALAGAAVFALRPGGHAILLDEVVARPLDDGAAVFLRIENAGGPDTLVAVRSAAASSARLEAPEGAVPIPAEGAPQLAADGAHIRLEGVEGALRAGRLIPVTLVFAEAGAVTAQARVADPAAKGAAAEVGLFGLGDICIVGEGEPAPAIALDVAPDGAGWRVRVMAEDFTFSEDWAGGPHIPGMGHGHLYVGGAKLARLYGPEARIGPLPPGRHEIRVTLNTNDHRAYVVDDVPVTAAAWVEVR